MKFESKFFVPVVLTFAMASVSTLVNSGRCLSGVCFTIPMPAAIAATANAATTQQGPGRGQAAPVRDVELEVTSRKSLEAAWYYFKKKADKSDPTAADRLNKSIESRLTEIMDTHPDFSKMDEVFYLLGALYQRWNQPEQAAEYLGKVVNDYPDSKFFKDAKKHLESLNAGKEKKKNQPAN